MEIGQSPGGAKDTDKGLGCPEPTFLPTSTNTQDTELMLTGLTPSLTWTLFIPARNPTTQEG